MNDWLESFQKKSGNETTVIVVLVIAFLGMFMSITTNSLQLFAVSYISPIIIVLAVMAYEKRL